MRKVERLTETVADSKTRLDASSDIRLLVGKVVLHPGAKRGEIHATLQGSLMGIPDFANDNAAPDASRVITSVTSGWRGHPCYDLLIDEI
jgi:site-specific DNA recombinase